MLLTVSVLLPSKGPLLGAPDQARNHLEVHLDLLQLLLLLHLHPALPPQAFASALLQHCSAGIDATEWGKNDETEEMWITKLAIYPWACKWLEGARVRRICLRDFFSTNSAFFYQGLSCGGQRRFVETLLASDSRLGGRTVKGGVGWHRGVERGRRIFCLKLSEEIFDNNSFIIHHNCAEAQELNEADANSASNSLRRVIWLLRMSECPTWDTTEEYKIY